jgi:hypothetical protein
MALGLRPSVPEWTPCREGIHLGHSTHFEALLVPTDVFVLHTWAELLWRDAVTSRCEWPVDSSHSLTARQSGVSRCAWLSRTQESAHAS